VTESAGVSSKVLRQCAADGRKPQHSADHQMVNQLWSAGERQSNKGGNRLNLMFCETHQTVAPKLA
jgi:hypothetical protein